MESPICLTPTGLGYRNCVFLSEDGHQAAAAAARGFLTSLQKDMEVKSQIQYHSRSQMEHHGK